jgi:hypothetical protein
MTEEERIALLTALLAEVREMSAETRLMQARVAELRAQSAEMRARVAQVMGSEAGCVDPQPVVQPGATDVGQVHGATSLGTHQPTPLE